MPLVLEAEFGPAATRLNAVFRIQGKRVVMSTAELSGVLRRDLGARVRSLQDRRDEILAAVDFLISGI